MREAARLMDVATQSAATDPLTGEIDMGLIVAGHSSSEQRLRQLQVGARGHGSVRGKGEDKGQGAMGRQAKRQAQKRTAQRSAVQNRAALDSVARFLSRFRERLWSSVRRGSVGEQRE